jgi:predicted nucleic acid-binding protein
LTRYLLDTGIIGIVARPQPPAALLAWMAAQADDDLHISVLTVAEIRRAILARPAGRKRRALEAWFAGPEGPSGLFTERVLPFDDRAARIWAELMIDGAPTGRPRHPLDMVIAAIARAHDCMVVSDDDGAYAGLPMLNPLRDAR